MAVDLISVVTARDLNTFDTPESIIGRQVAYERTRDGKCRRRIGTVISYSCPYLHVERPTWWARLWALLKG